MMPLKGCLLKHYYPETFYRSMSDMDILVRQEDRASVRECMEKLGYETECFGKECHDVYMKPPVTNVEIHHVLFEEEHSIYRDFFQKIRKGINGDEAGVYAMSKERYLSLPFGASCKASEERWRGNPADTGYLALFAEGR